MRSNVGEKISYSGFLVDVLEEASKRLNFDFTIKQAADNVYGREMDNSWSGVIGEVNRGVRLVD